MRAFLKSAIKRLPIISHFVSQRDKVLAHLFVPPGHFYSPIPSLDEIRNDESRIFEDVPQTIVGIDLHETEQLSLLKDLVHYYQEMPFRSKKVEGLRYYFENPNYSYADAIILHCMIRHLKPRRLIEIGSGYSSCVSLDTNELFFDGAISTTFVEPNPSLLMGLLKEEDKNHIRILTSRLQDVDIKEFEALNANDILFIDSTHVSKTGSDVNRIFFEILPRLSRGVYVHIHDVFYPFEYPKEWVYESRAWNEAYILRAFLQYSTAYQIVLMTTFMEQYHRAFFVKNMPLCLQNAGGNIWIRRM